MSNRNSTVSVEETKSIFSTRNLKHKIDKSKTTQRNTSYYHNDDSLFSSDDDLGRSRKQNLYTTDSKIFKLKLKEIETLRRRIESLEQVIKSESNTCKSGKVKSKNCFSFFDFCTRIKRNDQQSSKSIPNPGDDNIINNISQNIIYENKKFHNNTYSSTLTRRKRPSSVINNNTNVLPECFSSTNSSHLSLEVVNNLMDKIEMQAVEIQEIKESISECIQLLKHNQKTIDLNNFSNPQVYDDHLKFNQSTGDYNQTSPFYKQNEVYRLSFRKNKNKPLNKTTTCVCTDGKPGENSPSDSNLSLNSKLSEDSKNKSNSSLNMSGKQQNINTAKQQPIQTNNKNNVTLKVSPLTPKNMPKDIRSNSKKSISVITIPSDPNSASNKCLNKCKSNCSSQNDSKSKKSRRPNVENAKQKAKSYCDSILHSIKTFFCWGKQ